MKILVVNGLIRSGKSITQRVLNRHSKVCVLESGAPRFFRMLQREYLKSRGDIQTSRLLCIEYRPCEENWKNIFSDIHFDSAMIDEFVSGFRRDLQIEGEERDIPSAVELSESVRSYLKPGPAGEVLRGLCAGIASFLKADPVDCSGLMEHNLEEFFEPLLNYFENDIRIVQLRRDPRSIYTSRNYGSYVKAHGKGKYHSILATSKVWRTSVEYCRHIQALNSKQFDVLRFEAFMADPEKSVRDLCHFLDVEFEPSVLELKNFSNSAFAIDSVFPKTAIRRWEGLLKREDQAVMELLIWKEMQEERYPPEVDAQECKKGLECYEEYPATKVSAWIAENGLLLNSENKKRELERFERLISG